MSSDAYPPDHHCVRGTVPVRNLPAWLEWIKDVTGYSDHTLAICLGTDARQVDRWRNKRVVPKGRAMAAIVLLAERIPGAHDRLLYPGGRPAAAVVREAVTELGDVPPFHPGDRAA